MRKSIIISILILLFSFSIISCSNTPDTSTPSSTTTVSSTPAEETKDNFPKLKIINTSQITITSVSLEGYQFSNLSLKQNQSMVFELKDGMPAGYKDVRVSVRYRPYIVTNSPIPPIVSKLDFADGVTTSLEIKVRILL